ncbi:7408_t:CDS:1, partial [Gigaspora rosea]
DMSSWVLSVKSLQIGDLRFFCDVSPEVPVILWCINRSFDRYDFVDVNIC